MSADRAYVLIGLILTGSFLAYSFGLYAALPAATGSASPAADTGKALWQRYNCTACHQVYGLGGFLGPDLTNVHSQRGPAHIRAMLRMGTNTMPAYPLTDAEIESIIAYLEHIDGTGVADPRSFKRHADGSISQP